MDRKKLRKHLIYLIFFIFLANFIANKFYWYSAIWWFDMPMHFLGGFWLGLLFLYLSNQSFRLSSESKALVFKILFFVLFVGVGWEFFEILFYNIIAKTPFNYLDTVSDIFFDLSGGAFAILYFLKRIMSNKANAV